MKAVILNGIEADDASTKRIIAMVEAQLKAVGATLRHFYLRDLPIGHCTGEFDCWIRTPGRCYIKDEGQEVERAVHDAELVVLLTPLLFGGFGPQLKKAVDRLIPLILPWFAKQADFTHHQYRYQKRPQLVGIGIGERDTAEHPEIFRGYVESAALDLGAPMWSAVVLGRDDTQWSSQIASAFDGVAAPGNASGTAEAARSYLVEALRGDSGIPSYGPGANVALLLASARRSGTSTSQSIIEYWREQLTADGAKVTIVPATEFARGREKAHAAAETLARAEVLAVVSPLYVDGFPYLALLALQQVAAARKLVTAPQRVVGIINCGFPEPEHTRFAFRSLRQFAHACGAHFAGGIAVGGGEAIHGQALAKAGPKTLWLRRALDEAARALSAGLGIPHEISDSTSKPFMPPALYRFGGEVGWTVKAVNNGFWPFLLKRRPFDSMSEERWAAEAAAGYSHVRPLRVLTRYPESADTVTILFEDPAHDQIQYLAGQYITLELEIDGQRVRRAYSLASGPSEPGLAITVKRVPGGKMSNALHDGVQPGDIVKTYGPAGSFVTGDAPIGGSRKLLLVAGGSGIVPVAAIARDTLRREPDAQVTLIYGAASRARAIYVDALDQLAAKYPSAFRFELILEDSSSPSGQSARRLDQTGIGALLDALSVNRFDQALLCGPDPMRASVRALLTARGVLNDRIREESFSSPRVTMTMREPQSAVMLRADGEARTLTVAPGEALLDACLNAGEELSFSCMSGGCGACEVVVLEGLENLVLDEPNEVTKLSLERGFVPACITRLKGPIRFRKA